MSIHVHESNLVGTVRAFAQTDLTNTIGASARNKLPKKFHIAEPQREQHEIVAVARIQRASTATRVFGHSIH